MPPDADLHDAAAGELAAPSDPPPTGVVAAARRTAGSSFARWLAAITVIGLAVRLGFVLGAQRDLPLGGDAWVYHHTARFVGQGRGFTQPIGMLFAGKAMPTADHPPLFVLFLVGPYVLGIRSVLSQLILNALLGGATVPVIGLVGRRVGGATVGLVAALVAALDVGLWAWNGQVLSETLATALVAGVLLCTYRALDRPSIGRLVAVSALVGLATLARGELILLVPFVLLPLLVHGWRRHHETAALLRRTALAAAVVLVVLAPWAGYNLARFAEPSPLSTGFGRALDSGGCGPAFFGGGGSKAPGLGYWDASCLNRELTTAQLAALDESQLDRVYRDQALTTLREHPGQVPVVLAARVGRMFHLYDPGGQLVYDMIGEQRQWWVAGAALGTFYLLAATAVVGGIAIHRRGGLLWALVGPIAVAAVGATIAFGTTRYRAPAEPALVVLAAAGMVAVARASLHRWDGRRAVTPGAAHGEDQPPGTDDDGAGQATDGPEAVRELFAPPGDGVAPAGPGAGRHDRPLPLAPLLATVAAVLVLASALGAGFVVLRGDQDKAVPIQAVPAPPLPPA